MIKRIKKRLVPNLIILVITIILLLFLAEGVAKLAGVEKYNYDVIFKETNDERVFSLRPNAEGQIKGSYVKVNSNELRDYEYAENKPLDVYRVAVLGASFTFGEGISLEETYSKILENMLNNRTNKRYEVINFGVPGYSISQQEARIMKDSIKYNPDMIIIYLGPRRTQEFMYIPFKDFLKKNSYLFAYLHQKYATIRFLLQQDIEINKTSIVSLPDEVVRENMESFKKIINYSKSNNIRLIVLNFPLLEENPYQYIDRNVYETFINYTVKEEIMVVDILALIEKKNINVKDFWINENSRHPNKKANTLVAEELFKVITNEN